MGRIIAVKESGQYIACTIKFDGKDVTEILDKHYAVSSAARFLVAGGDMIGLTQVAAVRSSRARAARRYPDLDSLLAAAQSEGIHRISIRDRNGDVMEDIGSWNMDCDGDKELFVENISHDRAWHHVIDGDMIIRVAQAA